MNRKIKMTGRLTRRGSPEEKEFNDQFWRKVDPSSKLEEAWNMVLEIENFRGNLGAKQRFQRTVQSLKRRKG